MRLPFCAACVRTDDNALFNVQMLPDPTKCTRFSIKVINGNIEEALYLTSVKVHRDDMVASSCLEHIGHELGRDGRSRLVFLVLASIWEVGNHGSDATCRRGLASVDHDQKLHESVVDIARGGGLKDEDYAKISVAESLRKRKQGSSRTIFVTNRLSDGH